MKKLILGAAAIVLPLGSVAGIAGAAQLPFIDGSNATISCTNVTGKIKFSPAITTNGGSPLSSSVKLKISGCTTAGISGPIVKSGLATGTLHTASNSFSGLNGTIASTGTIYIVWKTKGNKLINSWSSVSVNAITAGTDANVTFDIKKGDSSVTGSFTGGDDGANSEITSVEDTVSSLIGPLSGKKGIKSLTVQSGSLALG